MLLFVGDIKMVTRRPHLKYGMPTLVADTNHLKRIQRLVAGMRHLPYEKRLQRLGLHSLQQDNLITVSKIFKGLLDIDPNLVFLPPARRGLRGHHFKVIQGARHRRKRRVGIFCEGCEILE